MVLRASVATDGSLSGSLQLEFGGVSGGLF
jgi:hypothetical protein